LLSELSLEVTLFMKDDRQSDKDIFGIFAGQGIRSRFLTGRPGGMGSRPGFFEKCRNFWFKCRQVIFDDTPDNGIIDPEIPADDLVPECPHIPPRDILMFLFDWVRDIFCGFPDNFNCASDRMGKIIIVDEIVKCPVIRYFS
jgi:hypothetical protein